MARALAEPAIAARPRGAGAGRGHSWEAGSMHGQSVVGRIPWLRVGRCPGAGAFECEVPGDGGLEGPGREGPRPGNARLAARCGPTGCPEPWLSRLALQPLTRGPAWESRGSRPIAPSAPSRCPLSARRCCPRLHGVRRRGAAPVQPGTPPAGSGRRPDAVAPLVLARPRAGRRAADTPRPVAGRLSETSRRAETPPLR